MEVPSHFSEAWQQTFEPEIYCKFRRFEDGRPVFKRSRAEVDVMWPIGEALTELGRVG